jgi:hypothetical protein
VSIERTAETSDAGPVIIKNKNHKITLRYFVRSTAVLDENKHLSLVKFHI